MKVWNLRCAHGHGFEGWFASEEDYVRQQEQGLLSCPLCGDVRVVRSPSAPRLNLSGARETDASATAAPVAVPSAAGAAPTPGETTVHPTAEQMQRVFLQAVRSVMASTEDVGERFPEEARRIHLGEVPSRGIRGQATPEEREELREEGIEVFSLPVPEALKGPTH